MVNLEERVYNELVRKNEFVERLNSVITEFIPNIELVELVVFYNDNKCFYKEYVVVHYNGGVKCTRNVTINSNSANFREIAKLLNGGYYEENSIFEEYENNKEFRKLVL